MISLKEILANMYAATNESQLLQEYNCYKLIPCTRNSYREDPMNSATKTDKHSHVYAKPNGGGKQIYAVNQNGTGHDGSTGVQIPASHAEYFRSQGYIIPTNNVLEYLDVKVLKPADYQIIFG